MATETARRAVCVRTGTDRSDDNRLMIWGIIPLAIKVSAKDTDGRLFVFEHRDMGKGGPPRHIHHEQDEYFYVVAGEYAFEIGEEKFRLTAGDSLLAPRKVPHAWANVGDAPGTLLTELTPAGTFEEFILETTRHKTLPPPEEIAKAFTAHQMTVVGPPLKVD